MGILNKFLVISCLLLVFSLFIVGFFKPVSFDFDLGRHLLFGKLIWQSHNVINSNLLSFTNPDFHYVNSHWLSEVILFQINQTFGYKGLTLFAVFISLASILILVRFVNKRVGFSALAVSLAIYVSFLVLRTDVRPELFSYFFSAVTIVILYKFREKHTKQIFLLIPIFFLWVNLHIYFGTGLLLLLIFLIDSWLGDKGKIAPKTKTLLYVFLFSVLASLLNPSFVNGLLNPISFIRNYGIKIEENLSFFSYIKIYSFKTLIPQLGLMASMLCLMIAYRKKIFKVDWLIFLIFASASILAFRNFYIYLYVSFYLFCRLIKFFSSDIDGLLNKYVNDFQHELLKSLTLISICILIFVLLLKLILLQGIGFYKIEMGKPAVDFFLENELKGPIYNSFDFGQYLAYRLYPKEKVYVDGRPEAYPAIFLQEHYSASQANYEKFKREDATYNFNVVFGYLNYLQEPVILQEIVKDNRYALVFLDSYAIIYLKKNDSNKNVIKQFRVTDKSFRLTGDESTAQLSKLVLVFDSMGWKKAEVLTFKKLIERDKEACLLKEILRKRAEGFNHLNNISLAKEDNCFN